MLHTILLVVLASLPCEYSLLFGREEPRIASDKSVGSWRPCNSSRIVLQCQANQIMTFVNRVHEALKNDSALCGDCRFESNCLVAFENLPCSMSSFVESMLSRHLKVNYETSLDNEMCTGFYHRSHGQHRHGHMVQFLLDVIELRRWVSVVLFVDEEDEFPGAAFLQILTSRNVQGLILKLNSDLMNNPASVVPSAASQYYHLVVISKRYHTILEVAHNRSLFLVSYKWVILANSSTEVVRTLNQISLQFTKDVTIVSPIKCLANSDFNNSTSAGNRTLVFVCENNGTVGARDQNHLATLSSKKYKVNFYAMLCGERGLDLLSSGSWERNLQSINHRMNMMWPTHKDMTNHNFQGCIFRVVVAHNPPYVILNRDVNGNFTLSGYDYDVFMELANLMKFGYEFYVVEDGQYGRLTRSRTRWTGLIGQLVDRKAHLALPSLVLTEDRYRVVDFSAQISTAKTKVLIRRLPSAIDVNSYLAPFDSSVWTLFVVNVILFSIAYVVINLLSPREDVTCASARSSDDGLPMALTARGKLRLSIFASPDVSQNIRASKSDSGFRPHHLWDSLFTFVSSALQQVPHNSPVCWSGRVVVVTFFLFVVIIHTSFSSTLVSYMYVLRPQMPFAELADLATTDDYIPCILRGSSHEELLRAHHGDVLRRILLERGLVTSHEEGIARVHDRDSHRRCAFIGDSVNIEYILGNNCSFMYVGKDFFRVRYHFAFQKGFPHQTAFSFHLSQLRQSGHLTRLWRKHMKPRTSLCLDHTRQTSRGFSHLTSMFLELIVGLALAVTVFIIEQFAYYCRRRRRPDLIFPTGEVD